MAQSAPIQVTGAITGQPAIASLYSCTLQALMDLHVQAVYESVRTNVLSNLNSTDLAPFSVPFETITKGRFFAIRLLSGNSMKLRITTALGVAVLPLSDLFLTHVPNDGDEMTAIQIVGIGDCAYVLAGNVL